MESGNGCNVSVIIPILNEEKYLDAFITSLFKQDYPRKQMEWIFVDGCSQDDTVKKLETYIEMNSDLIKLYHNKNKTVPYAMNIGIINASGKYIVRLDAHSVYADDYISKCVLFLEKTGADNVGGPMVTEGKTGLQKVIAASYHSKFALGGGKFHDRKYEGYADTVYLGAYKRQVLLNIGMYDERFTRNQDDELNYRLIKNGGKIYITPQIRSVYYPRNSYRSLIKQYFQYGEWKPAVIKKHGMPARWTHLVPPLFVAFLAIGLILSVVLPFTSILYSGLILLYILINFAFSFKSKDVTGLISKLRLMYVHFLLHCSYGTGFIYGLFV